MARNERRLFKVTRQVPEPLGSEKKAELITRATRDLQEVEIDSMGRQLVGVGVNNNEPLLVLNVGDLHVGSLATDLDAIFRLRDSILKTPNIMVVFSGDLIEGITQKYLHTNTMRTVVDLDKQFEYIDEILIEPLTSAGKVACAVGEYWGHEGWGQDATTDNPWRRMFDKYSIPIVANGGRLEVEFANGGVVAIQLHHNPPGKSAVEPTYGLRREALLTDEDSRADVYYSAHIHEMGVGKENFAGAVKSIITISCPTAKGSSYEVPRDRFGEKLGRSLADPINGGVGVLVQPSRRNSKRRIYPFPTGAHGGMINRALELLNASDQQGLKRELIETIHEKVESKPRVTLLEDRSVESRDPFDESPDDKSSRLERKSKTTGEVYAPQYDELFYHIKTRMPIALHPEAHVRLGSSYEGIEDLKRYQRELIEGNPHAFVVYLRSIVDSEVGKSFDRSNVLDKYVELIRSTGGRTLAFMLCEALRQGSWKGGVKIGYEVDKKTGKKHPVYGSAVAPGTYIHNKTGVPMIHHLSRIGLSIGSHSQPDENVIYDTAFADKLMNYGSNSRPAYGPRRLYDLQMHRKPDIIAGGHMPGSGNMVFYDGSKKGNKYPIEIMPGWWSSYIDTAGRGNVAPGAIPGQAVILMPGSRDDGQIAFPTADADETKYVHEALILLRGLEILDLTEKVLRRK